MDCGTEAALRLSSERDQMAAASRNSHLPLITPADMIRMHEKSGGCHDVPEEPGPRKQIRTSTLPGIMLLSLFGPEGR